MKIQLPVRSFIVLGLFAGCGEEADNSRPVASSAAVNGGGVNGGVANGGGVATTPPKPPAPDALPTAPPQFVTEPVNAQQQVPLEDPGSPAAPVATASPGVTPVPSVKSSAAAPGVTMPGTKPAATSGAPAGTGAAPSTGAAPDCATALLCDDFEGTAPGATGSPWKVTQGAGYTVEVQATQVHSGTHAVHVKASSATGNGYLLATKGFPATDFWGRVWMRVTSAAGGHQCLMALNTKSDQVRLLNEMGSGELATNLKSSDKINGSKKLPQDKWFCFEWHQSPTELHVYTDGTESTDAAAKWSIASIDSLQFGLVRFQAGKGNADIYYDDVAINTTRVGCD